MKVTKIKSASVILPSLSAVISIYALIMARSLGPGSPLPDVMLQAASKVIRSPVLAATLA